MSYRRAWLLIDDMNQCFRDAVVNAKPGGSQGGCAVLTEFGADSVRDYRTLETAAEAAAEPQLRGLKSRFASRKASQLPTCVRPQSARASGRGNMRSYEARELAGLSACEARLQGRATAARPPPPPRFRGAVVAHEVSAKFGQHRAAALRTAGFGVHHRITEALVHIVDQEPRAPVGHAEALSACEIEPVRATASSRRILPGPIDPLDPKSTRKVNLVSLTIRLRWNGATLHWAGKTSKRGPRHTKPA